MERGSRSSTIPVRISVSGREENGLSRNDAGRMTWSKTSVASNEISHIPKSRQRSCDRASSKSGFTKGTGTTPLRRTQLGKSTQLAPTTPVTPKTARSIKKGVTPNRNTARTTLALPTGHRSLSADRASSLDPKGQRKDSRPLLDKIYQSEMLAEIDDYFLENQQLSMLNSNGSLKPLTLKMFVEASDYLVKMLHIKQGLTTSNYIEELPKIAKKLHYPGVVTKSWLKTANAMHSWPNVLGWLSWLVHLCKVRQIGAEIFSGKGLPFIGNELEAQIHKHSFYSMLQSYQAWNEEKHDEEIALLEKYLEKLDQLQGASDEDVDKAHSKLNTEKHELQLIMEESDRLDQEVQRLTHELKSLEMDEARQLDEIQAEQQSIELTRIEIEKINEGNESLREHICELNGQRDELLTRIKQQPMSKDERDKIVEKCTEIQKYIDQYDEHLQDTQNELYKLDMKLASINNSLNKTILTYNKEIFMNLDEKIADIGIDLEELKLPDTGILQPQIMDTLFKKADLLNITKERLKKHIANYENSVETYHNQQTDLQQKIQILQDESNTLTDTIKNLKKRINQIKTETNDEEMRLREQIKVIQNDINHMEETMPNVQKVIAELEEAKDKLDAMCRRKAYIEQSAKLFFEQFYTILGDHMSKLYNLITKDDYQEPPDAN